MPGAHAYLSPSAAHRWIACPGSPRLSADALPTGSRAAREGSAAHQILEACLAPHPLALGAPSAFLGMSIPVTDDLGVVAQVPVTQDMVTLVETALDWIRPRLGRHVQAESVLPTWAAFGLVDVRCAPVADLKDLIWGTADVVTWNDYSHALIVDLKAGIHEVETLGNHQLTLYALGLMAQTGWAFDSITVAIVQPRVGEPAPLTFTRAELEAKVPFYERAIRATLDPSAPLSASLEACRYCPAAPTCPALQEHTLALAKREFGAPDLLAPTDMAFILERAPMIRAALDAIEAHAIQLLQLGRPVPGFKLVTGRRNRVWKNEEEAVKVLASLGYDADAYAPRKLISPAGAEKLVKNKNALAPLVETPEGAPKLAKAEDPRPALVSDFGGT